MWYVAGSDMIQLSDKKRHSYVLKYTESVDGIDWSEKSETVLEHQNSDEYGFGRPFMIREDNKYKYGFISLRVDN